MTPTCAEAPAEASDAELVELAGLWPRLPAEDRAALLRLARAAAR